MEMPSPSRSSRTFSPSESVCIGQPQLGNLAFGVKAQSSPASGGLSLQIIYFTHPKITMNYLIDKIDDDVSRLILHWKPFLNGVRRPYIERHCRDGRGVWISTPGAVLGYEGSKSCAIVINVKRHDLISLRNRRATPLEIEWSHYRIGCLFELHRIPIGNHRLRDEDCDHQVYPENSAPIAQPTNCDDDLRNFLAKAGRPRWLKTIINRQVQKWRTCHPEKYYHLAPSCASAREITLCVTIAPFTALRFFKDKLSKKELGQCIWRSIQGGVIFAFDLLTPRQIKIAIRECPDTMLSLHAEKLSDEDLELCVRFDPFAGIRIRNSVPPHRHAVLLAYSYSLAFPMADRGLLGNFHAEIEHSLMLFPETWLRVHNNSLPLLLELLETQAQMRIDNDFLLRLLVGLPREHQGIVARYLSDGI